MVVRIAAAVVLMAVLLPAVTATEAHAAPAAASIESSSYLGGSGYDRPWAEAEDPAGDIYLAGYTTSANFPVTPGAAQTTYAGGGQDAFVAKLSPDGRRVLYATYLGGTGFDGAFGVTADAAGDAIVTGVTCSTDFPVTAGAYQPANAGGCDAFVSVLNPTGSALIGSTYLGGKTTVGVNTHPIGTSQNDDLGLDVAVGPAGRIYVAGETNSSDFPTTSGAYQPAGGINYDAFVSVFTGDLHTLAASTYLGGAQYDYATSLAVDGAGNAYVTGETQSAGFPTTPTSYQPVEKAPGTSVFVTKLDPTLSSAAYSTLIGGSKGSSASSGTNYSAPGPIAIDAAGDVYVAGTTNADDYPTTTGAFQLTKHGKDDGFVTELNPSGSALKFSTYIGGTDYNGIAGLALGPGGDVYVSGFTSSADFPSANAFQPALAGYTNAFISRLDPTGSSLAWSSFLGGSQTDDGYQLALHGGRIAVSGITSSTDFPTVAPFQAHNGGADTAPGSPTQTFTGFVTVIDEAPPAEVAEAPGPALLLLLPVGALLAARGRRQVAAVRTTRTRHTHRPRLQPQDVAGDCGRSQPQR